MSCHFHLLRKRKAAEAAKSAEAVETKGNTPAKEAAAQKAAKGRRKGDA